MNSALTAQGLTDKQQTFVRCIVLDGKTQTESARIAGYHTPKNAAWDLLRNPKIHTALRLLRQTVYNGELASLSVRTLKNVMADPDASASAKVSAARTALELAGDISKDKGSGIEGKQLHELTPDQLAGLIDKLEKEKAQVAKDVTPTAPALNGSSSTIE